MAFPRWSRRTVHYWCSNERNWLIALSVFILVSGAVLAAAALYLVVQTAVDGLDNGSNSQSSDSTAYQTWVCLAVTGCFQVLVAILGIVAADKVSLYGLVLFFWLMALVMGVMFLFAVAALNFQDTFQTWIRHHWTDPELEPARKSFCAGDTANTLCRVPLAGFPQANQTAWCIHNFANDTCAEVQVAALDQAFHFVSSWMDVAGGIAISSVAEMLACLYLVLRLVTVPIIMKSMQSVINYFLIFPVIGSFVMAWAVSRYTHVYGEFESSIGYLFVTAGALLLVDAVVGVLAGHLSHRRLLYIHVTGLGLVMAIYTVLLAIMFYIYGTLGQELNGYSDQQTWELACDISLHGCCCCDGPPYSNHTAPACPEWTVGEISDNAAAVLKLGAITVLLDVVFVLCSLVASLVLLDNLKGYQCEYL